MRRTISYSLWGSKSRYLDAMRENLRLAQIIYPGWRVVIYVASDVPIVDELGASGAEIRRMPYYRGHSGSFWRLLAAGDMRQDVQDVVIVRDADSLLNYREKAAVDEWIASEAELHVMRDHPLHAPTPILAGMCGFRGRIRMSEKIARWSDVVSFGEDQRFLATEIWPKFRRNACVHSSCRQPLGGRPFPAHAPYDGFVGEVMVKGVDDKFVPMLSEHREIWRASNGR